MADVLITTGGEGAPPRTYLALQRVEVADFRAEAGLGGTGAGGPGEGASGAGATATLRVSLAQAVMLTAAVNFARELRLVPRSAGERRRHRPLSVRAADLGG
jgi:hypothetical protein